MQQSWGGRIRDNFPDYRADGALCGGVLKFFKKIISQISMSHFS
jgi:hypothetical protein